MSTHLQATVDSLNAAQSAFEPSPMDMYAVAYAVGMQRAEDEREAAKKLSRDTMPEAVKSPSLLGCYVNGKLRFQSRDHDAIYEYAERHMQGIRNFGNTVWVTPVGSFVTADEDKKRNAQRMNKVHKAAS